MARLNAGASASSLTYEMASCSGGYCLRFLSYLVNGVSRIVGMETFEAMVVSTSTTRETSLDHQEFESQDSMLHIILVQND